VIVTDTEKKRQLAGYYAKAYDAHRLGVSIHGAGVASPRDNARSVVDPDNYLRNRMHEVPAMLIPLYRGRLIENADSGAAAALYGSILPAVWSFMLAARAVGLGTVWTTLHLTYERLVADLLAIPYEEYTQVALIPVGYYLGSEFKPARRPKAEDVVDWNEFAAPDASEPR
jgi:nitroreductase